MTSFFSIKLPIFLSLLIIAAGISPCSGSVAITAAEVGSDVVFTYSGSINSSTLNNYGSAIMGRALVSPTAGVFIAPGGGVSSDLYDVLQSYTPFGTGALIDATSSAGSVFGFIPPSGVLLLGAGYTSGDAIAGTATFAGQNFTTLGLTAGIYDYSISGTDHISVQIGSVESVPEPSRALLLCLGLSGLACRRRRKV